MINKQNNNQKKNLMTEYKLTDESIKVDGKTLYRIELTKNHMVHGREGTKGGFIESEKNLTGNARVLGNEKVF